MRFFVTVIILTLYLFSYSSYQVEPYYQIEDEEITTQQSSEFVIVEDNSTDNELEFVEFQSQTPVIEYIDLKTAQKEAIDEHKFLLIKIESNNCPSCIRLNTLLDTNENIKSMVNTYTKAVKYNREDDKIPAKLDYFGTPTLFIFDSSGKQVLMKLQGNEAIDELEESLNTVIYDQS
ncbi:hypothetical protein MNB_SV-12-636 [hydrothermal vent metagenome]|uniref:Thioredoxin-like fold domain-containing protein n=1 Tax=hydrothermal vent metagenome TaxID=652676 RepID=A0A1W1BY63_9ZZZZ